LANRLQHISESPNAFAGSSHDSGQMDESAFGSSGFDVINLSGKPRLGGNQFIQQLLQRKHSAVQKCTCNERGFPGVRSIIPGNGCDSRYSTSACTLNPAHTYEPPIQKPVAHIQPADIYPHPADMATASLIPATARML